MVVKITLVFVPLAFLIGWVFYLICQAMIIYKILCIIHGVLVNSSIRKLLENEELNLPGAKGLKHFRSFKPLPYSS